MRRRMGVAIRGVLLLALLRVVAFVALAAGVSLLSWVPLAPLPWMTWGMWLFVLTTQAYDWFLKLGFRPEGVSALPPDKQGTYDRNRNSRVLVYQLT